jgi:hypothetical protein
MSTEERSQKRQRTVFLRRFSHAEPAIRTVGPDFSLILSPLSSGKTQALFQIRFAPERQRFPFRSRATLRLHCAIYPGILHKALDTPAHIAV